MWKRCVHFIASAKPVGAEISGNRKTEVCIKRSAGHTKHEYTTGFAHPKILEHFGFK